MQFQSLTSLESLPACGVEVFDVSANRLTSLSGIEQLPKLTALTADGNAVTDLTGLGRSQNLRIAQFDGQFVDASLIHALRLTGSLIAAVLAQIAFGTRRGDLGQNLVTVLALTPGEFFFHLVVRLLRQQDRPFLRPCYPP